jgi:hypothetical protein
MANPVLDDNTLARRKPIGEALGTKDTLLPTLPTGIHNATPPTLADGDVAPIQADDLGNVKVSLGDPAQMALLQQSMPIPPHTKIDWSDSSAIKFYNGATLVATLNLTSTTVELA